MDKRAWWATVHGVMKSRTRWSDYAQHSIFIRTCFFSSTVQFSSVAQSCLTLCDPIGCSPPGSFVHEDSPGKNTRVGCHALLQRIFPTQGSNPGLPHGKQILYSLNQLNQDLPIHTHLNLQNTITLTLIVTHFEAESSTCVII